MSKNTDTLFAEIDTPAVLIDLDAVERNLKRCQQYCDQHQLKLRPHIKTHKIPQFAQRQMKLGACGICCQKLGEAEIMAAAGLKDIFLTYPLIGETKLRRLLTLASSCKLKVAADSSTCITNLATAWQTTSYSPLSVMVECDTGGRRCGVQTPEEAAQLARLIANSPVLHFAGLMTYPAAGAPEKVQQWLTQAKEHCEAIGLPCEHISNGGSPDLWRAHEVFVANEHRAGTYIYNDRALLQSQVATVDDCAIQILTTIVSTPNPQRAIIDAGSKTLTSDPQGLEGFGLATKYPDAVITRLYEEHGIIDFSNSAQQPRIGERLLVIPNHACAVTNMVDQVHLIKDNTIIDCLVVAARGKIQ